MARPPQPAALQETQTHPQSRSSTGLGLSTELGRRNQKIEMPSTILLHTNRSSNFFSVIHHRTFAEKGIVIAFIE